MNKLILLLSLILSISLFSCDNDKKDDPTPPTPPIDNTYIDLGLSVKWASCNAGASSPEGYGEYYNWEDACKFNLPTKAQMYELYNKCTWKFTTLNGVNGVRVTGLNGNSIFMPCAGVCDKSVDHDPIYQGDEGCYWSSTSSSEEYEYYYYLYFDTTHERGFEDHASNHWYSVRSVSEK